jgi:hypothetical protein
VACDGNACLVYSCELLFELSQTHLCARHVKPNECLFVIKEEIDGTVDFRLAHCPDRNAN